MAEICGNPKGKTKRSKGYYWGGGWYNRYTCDFCKKRRKCRFVDEQNLLVDARSLWWLGYKPVCWGCYQWVKLSVLK